MHAHFKEYKLYYKRDFGEWEDTSLSPKLESFILENLWCGTRYQLYMTAQNQIGVGEASAIKSIRTKGSGQSRPSRPQALFHTCFFLCRSLSPLAVNNSNFASQRQNLRLKRSY